MDNFPYKLRLARKAAGLSQAALAEKIGISKQALSKYERGATPPDSTRLLQFAEALERDVAFFYRAPRIDLEKVTFRKRARLKGTRLHAVQAEVASKVEQLLVLEEALMVHQPFKKLAVDQLTAVGQPVEEAAAALRKLWKLGEGPIANVAGTMESYGIRIVGGDADEDFDGLSSLIEGRDGKVPMVVMNESAKLDSIRRRFTLIHELAHLILPIPDALPGATVEKICDQFTGAFLLPADALKRELGQYRRSLSLAELKSIRQRYGVSVAATVYRAGTLDIISEDSAKAFWRKRNQDAVLRMERGFGEISTEETTFSSYFDRLLARAVTERVISVSQAASLSGMSFAQVRKLAAPPEGF